MSQINTNNVGGNLSPDQNTKTYPENGLDRTKWGSQYDERVRQAILDDISAGKLTIDEMAIMLDLWPSAIRKWKGSNGATLHGIKKTQFTPRKIASYTRTPGRPGTNGKGVSKEQRVEIVRAIINNKITMDQAVENYGIYRSMLRRWCESKEYKLRASLSQPRPEASISKSASPVDKLMLNPGHARFVLDLLLTGSPDKAREAAHLFLTK